MAGRVTVKIKIDHEPISQIEAELNRVLATALIVVGEHLLDRVAEVAGIQRYTLRELAILGHPFSRVHGGGGFNPGLVSRQSGEFFEGFKTRPPTTRGGITSIALINDDPKAEWLRQGTDSMIDRPYMREISKGLDKKFMEVLLSALNPEYRVKLRGVR